MRPGDTPVYFTIFRQTSAGAASTGKTLSDFTIKGYKDGVSASLSPSIASIETAGTWQAYKFGVTLPSSGPYQFSVIVQAASGDDLVSPQIISGEVEAQDLDSLYATVSRPVGSLSSASLLASETQLEMVAYRENPIALSLVDQAGDPIDLSGYFSTLWRAFHKSHDRRNGRKAIPFDGSRPLF